MKVLKIYLVIIIFTLVLMNNCTYASMADYTEEDAKRDTQKMIQEHKESFDSTKSNNNYLKELTVKGIDINPDFDRQVINYSVKLDDNINEIEIVAISEDSRATVKGIGKIDIKNISECRIEVIAESGTTRTYFISINKGNETKSDLNNTIENELPEDNDENIEIVNKNSNIIKENENSNDLNIIKYKNHIIIGVCVVMLLLFVILFIKAKNKGH